MRQQVRARQHHHDDGDVDLDAELVQRRELGEQRVRFYRGGLVARHPTRLPTLSTSDPQLLTELARELHDEDHLQFAHQEAEHGAHGGRGDPSPLAAAPVPERGKAAHYSGRDDHLG
ncbi:MAG TPA: hypothetical protein VN871_01625 [Mycobacterium sp.]|nr:hypothetical protein [Mycobacterium sp.]